MKKNIFYITTEGITSTVFKSQVFELLNSEISRENEITLVLCQPINVRWSKNVFKQLIDLCKNNCFKVMVIPYWGFKNKFSLINLKLFTKVRFIFKKFSKDEIIFHCRAQEATEVAISLKKFGVNMKIIADIRGAISEELKEVNPNRANYFEGLDRNIFQKKFNEISKFNFISRELYKYYLKINNTIKEKAAIIPCFSSFNVSNEEKRNSEDIRLLYVGGQQFYQKLNQIPALVNKITNKNVTVYMVLNGRKNEELENLFMDEGINSEFYYNLSKKDLENIYLKSDIGILIRDNLILNKVSSPVKLSEYLSKGLYVMLIGEVGDFYADIKNNSDLGIASSDLSDLGNVNIDITSIRETCEERIKYASKFSKEYCVEKYKNIYEVI